MPGDDDKRARDAADKKGRSKSGDAAEEIVDQDKVREDRDHTPFIRCTVGGGIGLVQSFFCTPLWGPTPVCALCHFEKGTLTLQVCIMSAVWQSSHCLLCHAAENVCRLRQEGQDPVGRRSRRDR